MWPWVAPTPASAGSAWSTSSGSQQMGYSSSPAGHLWPQEWTGQARGSAFPSIGEQAWGFFQWETPHLQWPCRVGGGGTECVEEARPSPSSAALGHGVCLPGPPSPIHCLPWAHLHLCRSVTAMQGPHPVQPWVLLDPGSLESCCLPPCPHPCHPLGDAGGRHCSGPGLRPQHGGSCTTSLSPADAAAVMVTMRSSSSGPRAARAEVGAKIRKLRSGA